MSEPRLKIAGLEQLSDEELAEMYDGIVCDPRYGEGVIKGFVAKQFIIDEYRYRRTAERDEKRHSEMMKVSEEMGKFTKCIYRFTIVIVIATVISTIASLVNVVIAIW